MKSKKVLVACFLSSIFCSLFLLGNTNKVINLHIGDIEALTSTECTMQLGETLVICIGDKKNACHEIYNNIDVYCDGIKVFPKDEN